MQMKHPQLRWRGRERVEVVQCEAHGWWAPIGPITGRPTLFRPLGAAAAEHQ